MQHSALDKLVAMFPEDIELLERFIDDESEHEGQSGKRLGDVALGLVIALSGQHCKDYGFSKDFTGRPNAIETAMTFGFKNNALRIEARRQWREYRVRGE